MKAYQREFIKFALQHEVLRFGTYTLKSGRISPYFFNAALFRDGEAFSQLSKFYADTIHDNFLSNSYDVLFGAAYKGIALGTATSMGLTREYAINIPVSFNRKEVKDHGEGGNIIGEPLVNKKAILIDDVITSGTTIKDSVKMINEAGGKLVGAVIAFNRQEKGLNSSLSAIQEIENELGIKIASIINFDDLVEYLQEDAQFAAHLPKILKYRADF